MPASRVALISRPAMQRMPAQAPARGPRTAPAETCGCGEKARALLCAVDEVNYLEGTGRGVILIKLGKGDRALGFGVASSDRDKLVVRTSRGAEKTISSGKYEITSRAGRGRELLKNGTLNEIVRPEVHAPAPLDPDELDGESPSLS